jgi:hypothetical protein
MVRQNVRIGTKNFSLDPILEIHTRILQGKSICKKLLIN